MSAAAPRLAAVSGCPDRQQGTPLSFTCRARGCKRHARLSRNATVADLGGWKFTPDTGWLCPECAGRWLS